jgi:ketosteroid isomerase-like protein
MNTHRETLQHLYDRFNARDIDGVFAFVDADVLWANGMDGGHVRGHDALREYWTRQWAMVSPHVEPVGYSEAADGAIVAEVIQTVRDLQGNPLEAQSHGLTDKTLDHVFHFAGGKVVRFDIAE